MEKIKSIQTNKAPAAIGPYAQANIAGGFVYVSGQIAIDPKTGALVTGAIEVQTERVLENLKAVLEAAGSDLDSVVKTTVYLTDINDFAKMNAVYAQYFGGKRLPARSAMQVVALPRGALVGIEAVALADT